jgi:hypothetical protein
MTIKDWQDYIMQWAESKGWNRDLDISPFCIGTQLTNFHSEISEAWEEIKNNKGINEIYFSQGEVATAYFDKSIGTQSDPLDVACAGCKPEGFPIELADLAIRLLHTCAFYGIDLERMIAIKMAYNKTRPFRHGGKTA